MQYPKNYITLPLWGLFCLLGLSLQAGSIAQEYHRPALPSTLPYTRLCGETQQFVLMYYTAPKSLSVNVIVKGASQRLQLQRRTRVAYLLPRNRIKTASREYPSFWLKAIGYCIGFFGGFLGICWLIHALTGEVFWRIALLFGIGVVIVAVVVLAFYVILTNIPWG